MRNVSSASEPNHNCGLCTRLAEFRKANTQDYPDWHNAPVATFGPRDAAALVVGLAPGLKGANRTGRPFTGDFAGDLLYATLLTAGLAWGSYGARANDGLVLVNCRITNAVRCVPPQNKPTPAEIKTCRGFLAATIADMKNLRAILALGRIAHESVVAAYGERQALFPFVHGAKHSVGQNVVMFDSYHCSRYNTNTGVLTPAMFQSVVQAMARHIGATPR